MSTLWMGDLDSYMDERFIRAAFAATGHVALNVKPILNKITGTPAGYCFVEFSSPQNAENALLKLNGTAVPGTNPAKRFKLNWASYGKDVPQQQGPEYSIFVGDLTSDVTDQKLLEFFRSRFPSCKAAKVVIDSTGVSRGYGFVRFTNESEQQRSMSEMQGARGCGTKPIRVSAATPKKPPTSSGTNSNASYNTASQQYLLQYQQYQQYLAAWQATYQQQAAQYYSGYGHSQYGSVPYQQYHDGQVPPTVTANNYTVPVATDYEEEPVEDQTTTEDPNPPINVAEENKKLANTEQTLFLELEESRWNPVESVTEGPTTLVK